MQSQSKRVRKYNREQKEDQYNPKVMALEETRNIKKQKLKKRRRIKKQIEKEINLEKKESKKPPKIQGKPLSDLDLTSLPKIVDLRWLRAGRNPERAIIKVTKKINSQYYGQRPGYKNLRDPGKEIKLPKDARWRPLRGHQKLFYW